VIPFNDLERVSALFAERGAEIAAVIVEPVAANMGMVLPADGFLSGLRALCDRQGSVLIFDGVITGFRVALGGAQTHFRVTPDLSTFGKVIGGRYGGRRETGAGPVAWSRWARFRVRAGPRPACGSGRQRPGTLRGSGGRAASHPRARDALAREAGVPFTHDAGRAVRLLLPPGDAELCRRPEGDAAVSTPAFPRLGGASIRPRHSGRLRDYGHGG
jgi:glutamate-1-semialdehyde 2,1-aminomutase